MRIVTGTTYYSNQEINGKTFVTHPPTDYPRFETKKKNDDLDYKVWGVNRYRKTSGRTLMQEIKIVRITNLDGNNLGFIVYIHTHFFLTRPLSLLLHFLTITLQTKMKTIVFVI